MVFNSVSNPSPGAKMKVIGVGGGGTNAINTMIRARIEGVDFISVNTDNQSLQSALSPFKIQIGKELTKGLGAGADPNVGRDAALEDRHEINECLLGSDMVFITAGMGGGTGTGGASVVAQIAREQGALTVGVVTKPFNFEGKRRRRQAEAGIERLREHVDTLIVIPNQRLLQIATPSLSLVDAFDMVDNVLVNAVKGISDIINVPGTINVDFADVKAIMSCTGQALMGIGAARGENRAVEAANRAISSPLLEDIDIEGATGILINISASHTISLLEANEACSIIQDAAHEDANIIFGAVIDETLGDEMRVTVIATGFPSETGLETHDMVKRPIKRSKESVASMRNSGFSAPYYSNALASKPQKQEQKEPPRSSASFEENRSDKTREQFQGKIDTHELAYMTMKTVNEPYVEESIANEPFIEPEPTVNLQARPTRHGQGEPHRHADEFLNEVPKQDRRLDDTISLETREQGVNELKSDDFSTETIRLSDEIDKKIDEALEIAERMKLFKTYEDDLDIPAFLRKGDKELPAT